MLDILDALNSYYNHLIKLIYGSLGVSEGVEDNVKHIDKDGVEDAK